MIHAQIILRGATNNSGKRALSYISPINIELFKHFSLKKIAQTAL